MPDTKTLIRSIYLYLAAFVGLMMIIIPVVDMIKVGLETWVFPMAAEDEYYNKYPSAPMGLDRSNPDILINKDGEELTVEDRDAFEAWKKDYQSWQEHQDSIDQKVVERQKDMVRDISTLIGGLFLFLTHGYVLRKDKKKLV